MLTTRSLLMCFALAALLVFASADALRGQQTAPSTFSRIVEGAKGFVPRPLKRPPQKPPREMDDQPSSAGEPRPKAPGSQSRSRAAAAASAAEGRRTSFISRAPKKPSRTISQYMAQERP